MPTQLLQTLADLRPWSLAALARELACEENRIRAQLATLQQSGIVPLQETAAGWQIRPALDLLDAAWLSRACPAAAVQVLTVTDSTNSVLARQSARANGDAILAEYQSAGRGRRGRTWQSPFAGQIILSMYWHYPDPHAATALSIVLGIAAASALRAVRRGGVVTYVTCSPHALETSLVVRDVTRLLAREGLSTEILHAGDVATRLAPQPPAGADREMLQLWPHLDGTDAMFCAVLRRTS